MNEHPSAENHYPAPTPPYEAQRLRDLYSLKILDTEAEDRFDRYTQLAADLFAVPIALVSLVDEHRQWFKSAKGIAQRETERSISFCAHAVADDKPLIIEDTHKDPRFAGNPLVQGEPWIRFYAGVPLHGASNLAVGAFCIIDDKPRQFTQRDLALLEQLASLVESELQQERTINHLRFEIERNAYYDPLTSLPNRRLLTDRLDYALQLAGERQQRVTVTLFDLDSFATYNKLYGRAVGDKLLQAVASRIACDFPPPNVIGRWRDDQFMLITTDETADRRAIGEKVLHSFNQPFQVGEHVIYVGAKVGVSAYPDDARDGHDLIQRANAAMRANRPYADSKLTVYAPSVESSRIRRHDLLRRLRSAINSDEITVAFQPEMNIRTGRLQGAEALLRWHDQELGAIPAMEAAGVVEQTNAIHIVGEHILRIACREAANWPQQGDSPLEIAINLAAAQLHQPKLVNQIARTLADTGLAGTRLVLELTETVLVEDIEAATNRMQALKPLGIRFAIDDFGTGYSSFAYLAQLPVNRLKIDKSFISAIMTSAEAAKVVTGLVELAHRLQLDVVAEGVETAEQLAFLQKIDCDLLQGFYYSPPLSPDAFRRFILSRD